MERWCTVTGTKPYHEVRTIKTEENLWDQNVVYRFFGDEWVVGSEVSLLQETVLVLLRLNTHSYNMIFTCIFKMINHNDDQAVGSFL